MHGIRKQKCHCMQVVSVGERYGSSIIVLHFSKYQPNATVRCHISWFKLFTIAAPHVLGKLTTLLQIPGHMRWVTSPTCVSATPPHSFRNLQRWGEYGDVFTFCVSHRQRKMYCGHARLCVCLCVCLTVRGRTPTLLHGPGCNLGAW